MLIAIDPFYVLSGFLIALNSRPISGKTKPVRVGREPAQEAVPSSAEGTSSTPANSI
jgi:hypothetical protein